MIEVPLTQGYIAQIDDEDHERIALLSWSISRSISRRNRNTAYARALLKGHGRNIYMHRYIMGEPEGMFIDHIDNNTLNNQKSNLRICTPKQNAYNCRRKSSKSGYKGVKDDRGRWMAYIKIDYKQIYLGSFGTKHEAAATYNEAAIKYFGEFALLNEIRNETAQMDGAKR